MTQDIPQNIITTVDAVILTMQEGRLHAVLHKRPNAPFEGAWALPGGFIHSEDGSAEDAVGRVIREKAQASGFWVEQLATFSGPHRDPRAWSVSIAYIALVPRHNLPDDTENVRLFDVSETPHLAFDHERILQAGVERVRGKGAYSTLPANLLGEEFTLPDLQMAYECVLGSTLDQSSFRRKINDLRLVQEIPGAFSKGGSHRPSKLYRIAPGAETFNRSLGGRV